MTNSNLVYRFRTDNEHTIDEIKNSRFYLPSTEELNDPMEGTPRLYFKTNKKMWNGFFKLYFLTYYRHYIWLKVYGEEIRENQNNYLLCNIESFPKTPKENDLFNKIYAIALKNKNISKQINSIVNNNLSLSPTEIALVLKITQPYFIQILSRVCKEDIGIDTNTIIKIIDQIPSIADMKKNKTVSDYEFSFWLECKPHILNSTISNNDIPNYMINFNNYFLNFLCYIASPKNNIISFSKNYTNLLMWGHYANSSKGICMIYDKSVFSLDSVSYTNKIKKINFFNNIGNLSLGSIDKIFNVSENKNNFNFNEDWQKKYWNNCKKITRTKLSDWKYENELRYITYNVKKQKYQKFNPKMLKGIIFGINTTDSYKMQIVNEVLKMKTNNVLSDDFKFYNAFFSYTANNILYV